MYSAAPPVPSQISSSVSAEDDNRCFAEADAHGVRPLATVRDQQRCLETIRPARIGQAFNVMRSPTPSRGASNGRQVIPVIVIDDHVVVSAAIRQWSNEDGAVFRLAHSYASAEQFHDAKGIAECNGQSCCMTSSAATIGRTSTLCRGSAEHDCP